MLITNMEEYYKALDLNTDSNYKKVSELVFAELEQIKKENPNLTPIELKSKVHCALANNVEPIIFLNNPFFYEIAMKEPRHGNNGKFIREFFINGQSKKAYSDPTVSKAFEDFDTLRAQIGGSWETHLGLYRTPSPGFDNDHNALGYSMLFKKGIAGILDDIAKKKKTLSQGSDEYKFCSSCECSLNAVIKIANKFAVTAENAISECKTQTQAKYMKMIASAALNIPENPPSSFYEGLAYIWFIRETVASLDGIGISSLGQVDLLLEPLYLSDIKNGVITKEEAKELVRLWLSLTDTKYNNKENPWAETSTCITLGGCDENGNPIYSEVTKIIIEAHCEMNLVAPKLNLRYSKGSPNEYLELISQKIIDGHNTIALSCDDVVIPSLEKCGFETAHARKYVNGGCQETIVEGVGHTAGAYLYVLLPAIIDMSLSPTKLSLSLTSENVKATLPDIIRNAPDFETFYKIFLENTKRVIKNASENQVIMGKKQSIINPCPIYSPMQKGCIESGKDYTEGGAVYNVSTICLCGIATLIDSLYSIKTLVYDRKQLTLDEFVQILLNNWQGHEALRNECVSLPKYGHGIKDVDSLANRFIDEINEFVITIENERGGKNILSMFTYYLYKTFAKYIRATPDGRYDGDYLSQGISASRIRESNNVTDIFETIRNVQYTKISGIHVLDLMFDQNVDAKRLAAFIKSAGLCGCSNMQINCVSKEELLDAKSHPEKHKSLIVRVAGLSVYFVNLEESTQNEFISRTFCK